MTLLTTAYLPPVSWLMLAHRSEVLTLEACEHFQKGSVRNRCQIIGPNGVQRLSIPLEKGKHQQTPIRDVRISYSERWQQVHWRSIQTAYGNAPYFDYYVDELERFYTAQPVFLYDFNQQLIEFLLKKFGWRGAITHTQTYTPPLPPSLPLPIRYTQVFQERHGFVPDMSGLDLLMCCGKLGGEILKS